MFRRFLNRIPIEAETPPNLCKSMSGRRFCFSGQCHAEEHSEWSAAESKNALKHRGQPDEILRLAQNDKRQEREKKCSPQR